MEGRRAKKKSGFETGLSLVGIDRGFGKDWREYENSGGLTHVEELLVYQPADWRKQAREYMLRFEFDLKRNSESSSRSHRVSLPRTYLGVPASVTMKLVTPILLVLFHPGISRIGRYEPLNFLLAYGARFNPRVDIPLAQVDDRTAVAEEAVQQALIKDLSPLVFFLYFADQLPQTSLKKLKEYAGKFPRFCLVKEVDFSFVVGQRLAKDAVRRTDTLHVHS